jgi:hypothetical protein
MDQRLIRVFQNQISLQCEYILRAANEINVALNPPSFETATVVFYAVQNLLNAAANISKALWGAGGRFADARQPLRDSLGIADTSPFREVTMRNNFEHFDERLDVWWRDSPAHSLADVNVGPAGMLGNFEEIDIVRQFDPATTEVIFWGQRFSIQALVDEVGRVLPRLKAELGER